MSGFCLIRRYRVFLIGTFVFAALTAGQMSMATSPYDNPYGIQWNFQIGNYSYDYPAMCVASPDGSVWLTNRGRGRDSGPLLTWGQPGSLWGSWFASGYGNIDPYGQILQGNDMPGVPDIASFSNDYYPSVSMRGTTAYIELGIQGNTYWANQTPAQTGSTGNPMVFSVDPVSSPQGTPYDNAAGLDNKYNVHLLSTGGMVHKSVAASDGSMYFLGNNQGGDKFTPGDYTGISGSGYNPWVGKVGADGLPVSGPAQQPNCDAVRSYGRGLSRDEATGRVYMTGYSYERENTGTYFDPDGSGPLLHTYTATPVMDRGWGVVWDSSWNVLHSMFWESDHGGERIYDQVPTADGGVVMVGTTQGDMPGQPVGKNPAHGTNDVYIAKYDAAGALVWDYQSGTLAADWAVGASVDPEGNVYVSGTRYNGTDNDPILMKFTSAGTLVWTSTIDNNGSQDSAADSCNITKEKIYLYSTNQPYSSWDTNPANQIGDLWTNTTGYVPYGQDENLLQKLSPGDFDGDGFTNWDDLNDMIDVLALAGGSLPGDDTYDFDGDGDSTYDGDLNDDTVADDVDYFMRNIFDSDYGDFNWNGVIDYGVDPNDGILTDEELLGGWQPGDTPIPLTLGWRGFAGPLTPNLIDFEEWDYLFDLQQPPGVIPEPSTFTVFALGVLGLGLIGLRRRKRV